MKLGTIVNAAQPLQKLIFQDLPLKTAYGLAQLIGRINPALAFYGMEMAKAPDGARAEELSEMEMAGFEDIFRLQIDPELPLVLSAADIKCLEPFIRFEKDDGP